MRAFIILVFRVIYKGVFKPLFFRQDPEVVHDRITRLGGYCGRSAFCRRLAGISLKYKNPALNQEVFGIFFKNPVGLSAGFDKNANLFPFMSSVGFGFAEIGTVTYGSYQGNPQPRLYRLPKSKGLVVNYGLKNNGAGAVIQRIGMATSHDIPAVISIGRTNCRQAASLESGINDYYNGLKAFTDADLGDAYEINISCPNTFGGEPFSNPNDLKKLLKKLSALDVRKPMFLKMPINPSWEEFKKILDVALEFKVAAVVIGNLNKNRSDQSIKDNIPENVNGSISGRPTWNLSNNLISETYKYCGDKLKVIGVGGIFSPRDAYEKIKRGASLVELITGMIYEGPQLIGDINRGLVKFLKRDGYSHISEAVGAYHLHHSETRA